MLLDLLQRAAVRQMLREAAKLGPERSTEVGAGGDIERPVSQSMIAVFESKDTGPTCCEHSSLQGSLDGIPAVLA